MAELGLDYTNNSKLITFNMKLFPNAVGTYNLHTNPNFIKMVEYHQSQGTTGRTALQNLVFDANRFFLDSNINPYADGANTYDGQASGAFATSTDAVLYFLNKGINVSNFVATGNSSMGTLAISNSRTIKNGIFLGTLNGVTLNSPLKGANYFTHMPDEIGYYNDVIMFGPNSILSAHYIGSSKAIILSDAPTGYLNSQSSGIGNFSVPNKSVFDSLDIEWSLLGASRNIISKKVVSSGFPDATYASNVANSVVGAIDPTLTMNDFAAQANGNGAYTGTASSGYNNNSGQIDNGYTITALPTAKKWNAGDTISQASPIRNPKNSAKKVPGTA
jgi:hypothetical protein